MLESLRNHLAFFTLSTVIDEITRRFQTGRSYFAKLATLPGPPGPAALDRVLPRPSG